MPVLGMPVLVRIYTSSLPNTCQIMANYQLEHSRLMGAPSVLKLERIVILILDSAMHVRKGCASQ